MLKLTLGQLAQVEVGHLRLLYDYVDQFHIFFFIVFNFYRYICVNTLDPQAENVN